MELKPQESTGGGAQRKRVGPFTKVNLPPVDSWGLSIYPASLGLKPHSNYPPVLSYHYFADEVCG